MGSEVAVIDAQVLRTMEDPPEVVLFEAKKAAQALQNIISKKKKPVMMNGEQYLEFEDWQTVGRFYGITAREDGDPEFVNLGGVQGFKASAVAIDRSGREIGRATAYCLNDEEKWRAKNKFAWAYVKKSGGHSVEDPGKDEIIWEENPDKPGKNRPKKERIHLGEEAVPLFQLSSMAQTRASAKALRNVLSWVVVLAGYRSTPAEELDGLRDSPREPQPEAAERPAATTERQPGEDREESEAEVYARAGVEPPARKPEPAAPTSGEKAPCPKCGKAAFPSKFPKAGQSHFCNLCKLPFAPGGAK
jgi:hypothetical protein